MRGLQARTPTCALHVHVGMPDAEAAIRAFNWLRGHLPLLQALAANSPFWYGRDSGLASARAHVFRALPRSEIPPAFASFDEFAERVEAARGGRRHAQLHVPLVGHPPAPDPRDARGQGDGQPVVARERRGSRGAGARARSAGRRGAWAVGAARGPDGVELPRRARRALRHAVARRRAPAGPRDRAGDRSSSRGPYARELGSDGALEGIERILVEGNGAFRQRAAFASGGMQARARRAGGRDRALRAPGARAISPHG